MSTLTTNLSLSKPEDNDTSWGDEYREALDIIDAILKSFYYSENAASHSGLNFAYKAGVIRYRNTVSITAGNTVALTDNATNYIEVNPSDGVVSANSTGFTLGRMPLFTVVTLTGAITTVTDKRSFITENIGKGTSRQVFAMNVAGTDYEWYSPERTRGIAFSIRGNVSALTEVSFVAPCDLTAVNVKGSIGTAPTGANLIMDVHKNGTTLFTTQANRPTITAGNTTCDSSAPDVTAIAAGDRITFIIDQVGSTVAGADLAATLICEEV